MHDVPAEGLAAAYLLFELTKFLVSHLIGKRSSFGEQEKFQLNELYNVVHAHQKETLDILRDISVSQRETAKIMERIMGRLER